jgi:hypothetical protein
VILEEPDEGRRRQVCARLAARPTPERRIVALKGESLGEAPPQMRKGRLVVVVVAPVLAREEHVQGVMRISVIVISPIGAS